MKTKSGKVAQSWISWDSIIIFWPPNGLGSSASVTASSTADTACLVDSGWLHSLCIGVLPVVFIPRYWHLWYAEVSTETWAAPSPMDSFGLSGCKASDFLHDRFNPGSSLHLRLHFHQWLFLASHKAKPQMTLWFLHAFKTSTMCSLQSLGSRLKCGLCSSYWTLCVLIMRRYFSEDFTSVIPVSYLSFLIIQL